MLFPVVIVFVLFVAGYYAVGYLGDGLSGVIEVKMTEWIEGISWLEWVSGVAGFLVKLLTRFLYYICLLYTSPSPRDGLLSRMPSSA